MKKQTADITPTIYILENVTSISAKDMIKVSAHIPCERQNRAQKYIHEKDRRNCLLSYFLLICGLKEKFNLYGNAIPEMEYGLYGKPFFPDSNIYFNMSHCDKSVCCAIASGQIGVDVQDIVSDIDAVMDITMSKKESDLIKESKEPCDLFTKLFSLKECFGKYMGRGLNYNLKDYSFTDCLTDNFTLQECLFTSKKMNGYYLSSCSEHILPELRIMNINSCINLF